MVNTITALIVALIVGTFAYYENYPVVIVILTYQLLANQYVIQDKLNKKD